MKKILTLVFCITLAASTAFAETEHRGNANNYVPPEGYGQDLTGFMYSNYKICNAGAKIFAAQQGRKSCTARTA